MFRITLRCDQHFDSNINGHIFIELSQTQYPDEQNESETNCIRDAGTSVLCRNTARPFGTYTLNKSCAPPRRRRPYVGVASAPFSWSVHVTLYTSDMLLDFCNAVYNESSTLTKSSKNDAGVFCNSPWYSNETQRRKSKSVFVDNFVKMKADAKSFV